MTQEEEDITSKEILLIFKSYENNYDSRGGDRRGGRFSSRGGDRRGGDQYGGQGGHHGGSGHRGKPQQSGYQASVANPQQMSFNNYLGGLGVQVQPNIQNNQMLAAYALQQQQQQQQLLLQQQAAAQAQAQGQPINQAVLQQQYQQIYGSNFAAAGGNPQQILLAQQQQQQQMHQMQLQNMQASQHGVHPQQVYQVAGQPQQGPQMGPQIHPQQGSLSQEQIPQPVSPAPQPESNPTETDALKEIEQLREMSNTPGLDNWNNPQKEQGNQNTQEWDTLETDDGMKNLGKRPAPGEEVQVQLENVEGSEPQKVKNRITI